MSRLDITDKQFLVLCELALRQSIIDDQFNWKEKACLRSLQKKSMVFRNGNRWTITNKGYSANNRYIQLNIPDNAPKPVDITDKQFLV